MRDLTIQTSRVCKSVLDWQRMVSFYTVRWGKTHKGPYQYGYTCECKGFKYRGQCKHIELAKKERCNWGAEAFCGSPSAPNKDGTCPQCGGPTESVRVGV